MAHIFEEAYYKTTAGTELESNKFVPNVLKIVRVLTSKHDELSSYCEKNTEHKIINTSLKKILIDEPTTQANKGKNLEQYNWNKISNFVRRLKKKTKCRNFHVTFKTAGLQDFVNTTLPSATVINVHIIDLHLHVPKLIPSPETQSDFNNSIRKKFYLII